jgi:hypothetical protein
METIMTDHDPIFLVEHFDPKENFRWCSCNDQWTRRNVIEGIYDNVLDCVVRVLEIYPPDGPENGCVFDVTRAIAEDVETYGLQNHNGQFPYRVLTFLHANGLRQMEMTE